MRDVNTSEDINLGAQKRMDCVGCTSVRIRIEKGLKLRAQDTIEPHKSLPSNGERMINRQILPVPPYPRDEGAI